MILRLFIAFTRWVWGISPVFPVADSEDWYGAMALGMTIDIAVTAWLAIAIIAWVQSRGSK